MWRAWRKQSCASATIAGVSAHFLTGFLSSKYLSPCRFFYALVSSHIRKLFLKDKFCPSLATPPLIKTVNQRFLGISYFPVRRLDIMPAWYHDSRGEDVNHHDKD